MQPSFTAFSVTARRVFVASSLMGLVLLSMSLAATPGSAARLDRGFGSAGKVTTNVAMNQVGRDAHFSDFRALNEGFTVTVRASERQEPLRVLRFDSDGKPDSRYGKGSDGESGVLTLGRASITRTLPDGRTIAAGTIGRGDPGRDVAVRRYLPDGTLDHTFGKNGLVRVSFRYADRPNQLVIGSTGEILVQAVSSSGSDYLSTSYPLALISSAGRVVERVTPDRAYEGIVAADDGTFRATRSAWSDGEESETALYRISRKLKITTIRRLDQDAPEWFGPIAMIPGNGFYAFRYGSAYHLEVVRVSSDGTIDSGYTATTCPDPPAGYPVNQSIQVDRDGRVLAGGANGCALLRTLPDGGLDPSFGAGGIAELPPFDDDPEDSEEGNPFDWAAEALPDGKIQLLRWNYGAGQVATARLNAGGRPDDSFDQASITVRQPSYDTARAVLATGRGYIVAGNSRCNLSGASGGPCQGLGLTAYRRSGQPDRTFGMNGKLTENRLTGEVLARVDKHKFLVAGSTNDGDGIALARFTISGRLDRSFGDDGVATATLPGRIGDAGARAVLVLGNGKILVTGLAYRKRTGFDAYLPVLRFLPDGRPDRQFGGDGIVTLRHLGLGTAIGRVGHDYVISARSNRNAVVLRMKPDGRLRQSFGKRGIVTPKLALRSRLKPGARFKLFRNTSSLKVTGNGILGSATDGYGIFGSALFKLKLNGRPDRRFGRKGTVWVGGLSPHAISTDRCRRITVTGTWRRRPNGPRSFGFLRLTGSGAPDRTLAHGTLLTPFGRFNGSSGSAASTGHPNRTVVVGSRLSHTTSSDFALAAVKNPGCRHGGKS